MFPDEKEEDIKMKLTDVFRNKFPLISSNLFEFVKCCKRTISAPTVCNDFKWDFGQIKSLAGQGKLYVRLIVPTHVVTENVSDEESSLEISTLGSTATSGCDNSSMNYASSLTNTSHSTNTSPVEPQQYLSQTSITPNIESTYNTEMVGLFDSTDDIHTLVNQLLDAELPTAPQLFQTLEESLIYLRSKMLPDICKRLKVEQDHVLEQAMCFYKHSDFEPNLKLRVTYDGQAGIDAGGLSRQFFTGLFLAASTGANEIPALFEGWNGQKLDAYNPKMCSCDLIETFGKIVAHSIVQTGLGLSCQAYAIYYYICTDKIESALPYHTIAEVPCHQTKEYLTQVQAIYFSFHNFY